MKGQLHFKKAKGEQDGYKQKTTHPLRCGNIKATIWRNESENGPYFATTFSPPFKDQSNGTSFGVNDLETLLTGAHEAKEWITAHALER